MPQDEFTSLSKTDLDLILRLHTDWLASDGKSGQQADLHNKQVQNASMRGMALRRVVFRWAKLPEAILTDAYLNDAIMAGVDLQRADLQRAVLDGADIRGGNLDGANLNALTAVAVDMRGVSMRGVTALRADLHNADFRGALLQDCDLGRTDLHGADLRGTALSGAKLEHVDLREVNVCGVDLSKASGLRQEQIDQAFGDIETLLPPGFARPSRWSAIITNPDKLDIPDQVVAPIRTAIRDGRVVLADPDQVESIVDLADLALHWDELKRDTQVLLTHEGNNPQLSRRMADYDAALGENVGTINEIVLGLRGEALRLLVQRAEEELLGGVLGDFDGLLAKHELFMRQLPKWLTYRNPDEFAHVPVGIIEFTDEQVENMLQLLESRPDLIDPAVVDHLKSMRQASSEEAPSLARKLWIGLLCSLQNVMSSLGSFAVNFGRKTRDEVIQQGSKKAALFLVALGGVGLMDLMNLLPTEFGWLAPVLVFLRKAEPNGS